MKHHIYLRLYVILLSACLAVAHAQQQDDKLTREMTLEREYDPTVQDANKINRLPEVKEPEVTRRTIEYSPFTIPANPGKELYILPSGNIMTAIPVNHRRGYFHFGGGTYLNLHGDFGYHFIDNETDKLNLYFSHRSTRGNVKYVLPSTRIISQPGFGPYDYIDYQSFNVEREQKAKLNNNSVGIDFKHDFMPAVLHIGGNFDYSAYNYYGLPFGLYGAPLSIETIDSVADRTTSQVNQAINAYAGVQSNEVDGIGYIFDVDFLRFGQKYGRFSKAEDGIVENKFTVRAGLSFPVGGGDKRVGLDTKTLIYNVKVPYNPSDFGDFYTVNYRHVSATPYFQMVGSDWKAKLGVNIIYLIDELGIDDGELYVSPNISLEKEIADKTIFYVNTEAAGIQPNDPYQLSKQNRYSLLYNTRSSKIWLDGTAGIRSGVVPGLWFDLFAGYRKTSDDMFFIPEYSFYPLVDEDIIINNTFGFYSYYNVTQPNSTRINVGATLKYMYQNWVDFSIKGVYNKWSFSQPDGMDGGSDDIYKDVKPYGRPIYEVNVDLTARPITPLALTLNYYLGGGRYTWFADREIKLNDLHDLNFTSSWNFNETIGIYLKLNNMLFHQQELWYGYPLQGFNAMAGVNLNF
ncbi:MAG: TonB-dependent receptor [Tannerella sp.]|jgi:hypothetical protein|nr:TonB-dependent receptor [Tannerella sp.]